MTQEFRSINSNVTGMLGTGNRPEDVIHHAIKGWQRTGSIDK